MSRMGAAATDKTPGNGSPGNGVRDNGLAGDLHTLRTILDAPPLVDTPNGPYGKRRRRTKGIRSVGAEHTTAPPPPPAEPKAWQAAHDDELGARLRRMMDGQHHHVSVASEGDTMSTQLSKTQVARLQHELVEATVARDRYRTELHKEVLRQRVTAALEAHGARPIKLLIAQAEMRLRVVEEAEGERLRYSIVAIDECGHVLAGGIEGVIKDLRADADFCSLFKPSAREEANGRRLANNPWRQGAWNATEQAKILRVNPGLAKVLQRQAGALLDDVQSRSDDKVEHE
jgi:hypothetical protein